MRIKGQFEKKREECGGEFSLALMEGEGEYLEADSLGGEGGVGFDAGPAAAQGEAGEGEGVDEGSVQQGEEGGQPQGGDGGEGQGFAVGEDGAGSGAATAAAAPRRPGFDASAEDVLLSLPAFANAANRALHERLLQRTRQLARATAETRENQERAGVMQEHLKHIRAELASSQRVAESKAKELRTEEHLAALAERALGRSRQDVSQHDTRLEEARAQSASLQAQIDKATAKLEAFRTSMNWKKEELERWTAAARQREEDVRALDE